MGLKVGGTNIPLPPPPPPPPPLPTPVIIKLLKNVRSLRPHIITTTMPNGFSGSCTDYYNFVDILVGFVVVVVVVVVVVIVVVVVVVIIIIIIIALFIC